ncbi:hypothetical protein [Treponema denticola]|uniref:hypothetical protein n=1 Tax=Treponema denticola TaxID=158 RepID=UPI0002F5EFCB|nr:hypothetical protein [Treponema denticola]
MFNPVVIAVIVMMVLCLLKINILIAIMISGIVGGIIGGLGLQNTISILISGMGGNAETALSYILLGTLAAAITSTSIVELLAVKLQKWLKNKKDPVRAYHCIYRLFFAKRNSGSYSLYSDFNPSPFGCNEQNEARQTCYGLRINLLG